MDDTNKAQLDTLINEAGKKVSVTSVSDPDYKDAVETYTKLVLLNDRITPQPTQEEAVAPKEKTHLKDWFGLIGVLGSTLLIVSFEAFGHTLTSRAWNERKAR